MVYLLSNVFGAEVNEEFPLGNAGIINDYGWFTNLYTMRQVTMKI